MAGLYAVSVPVFLRYLERLDGMLASLAAFAAEHGRAEEALLTASLAEGMFDLRHQFQIATNFSMRALAPFAPELAPLLGAEARTIAALRAEIALRVTALERLDRAAIDAAETTIAAERAGDATVETDALTFVTHYALPNFFFHLVTAYAILRRIGVPIGKADFDGFHAYPPGFRFV